jgi:putative ABC transport system substrate-binding protein
VARGRGGCEEIRSDSSRRIETSNQTRVEGKDKESATAVGPGSAVVGGGAGGSGDRVMDRRAFIFGLTGGLPLAAQAQPAGKSYRICFLALTPGEDTTSVKPLLERLRELGYGEGKNMAFEYRSAEGRSDRLPPLAMELVRGKPDVLIAGFGTLTAQPAKAATTTIPIVFTTVGDPVGAGLVASLGRAGGNLTGLSGLTEIGGKHLQLLQELSPGKQVIAVLMNPETPFTRLALRRSRPPRRPTVSVLRS